MLCIILGSGFSDIIHHFEIIETMRYEDVLDTKIYPLAGHERKAYVCKYKNLEMIILSGKLHFYEGYTEKDCVAPIAFAIKHYNITNFIVTSASGALSETILLGQWYTLNSITCIPNCLTTIHGNIIISQHNIQGYTYNYHQGPSLGTAAEYKLLKQSGIHFVGMSMIHEARYLTDQSIKTSYLTYPVCNYGIKLEEPSLKEVNEAASKGVILLLEYIINNQF